MFPGIWWLVVWLSGNALVAIDKLLYIGPGYYLDGRLSVCGQVYTISGCNQPPRSTQPSISPFEWPFLLALSGVRSLVSGGR